MSAFRLFGGGRERIRQQWQLDKRRYDIALKAVSYERRSRYETIDMLIYEWNNA